MMESSHCHVRLRPDGIVHAQVTGKASGATIREVLLRATPLLPRGNRIFLFDLGVVSGFDALSVPGPARALLEALKDRDYVIVASVTNGLVRMMGASLCAAAQVKIEMFASTEEADARARELAAQRPSASA